MKQSGQFFVPHTVDPFSRPADEVTTSEWRILIAALAGPFRVSQGFTKNIVVPAGNDPILLASNDKSVALFVQIRHVTPFAYALGGDPRSANVDVGLVVGPAATVSQVLLPKERLYATSVAGGTLVVTELTI